MPTREDVFFRGKASRQCEEMDAHKESHGEMSNTGEDFGAGGGREKDIEECWPDDVDGDGGGVVVVGGVHTM